MFNDTLSKLKENHNWILERKNYNKERHGDILIYTLHIGIQLMLTDLAVTMVL